jgi:hypothetical protein
MQSAEINKMISECGFKPMELERRHLKDKPFFDVFNWMTTMSLNDPKLVIYSKDKLFVANLNKFSKKGETLGLASCFDIHFSRAAVMIGMDSTRSDILTTLKRWLQRDPAAKRECVICYESFELSNLMMCPVCANYVCIDNCFQNIVRTIDGRPCPVCRQPMTKR